MKHIKKIFIVLGVLAVIALVVAAGGYLWFQQQRKPVSTDTTVSDFVITKGTNAEKVGQDLFAKGFIRNPLAFKLYIQLFDKTQKIQAGQFKLSPSYTMDQVIDALSKGPVELWVTIPEGLRREEVVEKVIAGLAMPQEKANTFRDEFLKQTETMEGYLFPDTYLFAPDANAQKVISAMKNTFDKRLTDDMKAKIAKSGYTQAQLVSLASIIERETKGKTSDERPVVAGIYFNRLRLDMPLQADATVQYALANTRCKVKASQCDWWPTVLRGDLELKSPYNTYVNTGIPPSAIANPGLSSLKAVIEPTENDYLYYIHEPDGTIHYAKTLQEHNANVAKYLGK